MADPVNFTRPAAERIAKVVRAVEFGNREGGALRFDRVSIGSINADAIRRCSWTENWATSDTVTITFISATNATATAGNVFVGVRQGQGWVARDGTAGWKLVSVDLTTQIGYDDDVIQMLGHNADGLLRWYSVTTCSTATAV